MRYTDKKDFTSAFSSFCCRLSLRLSFQCGLLAIDCFLFIYADYTGILTQSFHLKACNGLNIKFECFDNKIVLKV